MQMQSCRIMLTCATLFALTAAGCEGPMGAPGPIGSTGPEGPEGPEGPKGEDGRNTMAPGYVLSSACEDCHPSQADQWKRSGHGNAMVKVNDARPDDPPYSSLPAQPPTDDTGRAYTWNEISYIIGGFAWKAAFADAKGYLITGSQTQYLTQTKQWAELEKDTPPGTKTLDCPDCHATLFKQVDGHEISAKQNDLEGVEGTWIEEGVACEACHGPGGLHTQAQGYAEIKIDRSSAMCGWCHGIRPLDTIVADSGLIAQSQQYNELHATKMKIVPCVDCHDPHKSARYPDSTANPEQGIVTSCEICHYEKLGRHKVQKHTLATGPDCVGCHMPMAVRSALGDAATGSGDLRSHIFRINTDPTAPQLSSDGKRVKPYLTLNLTCRRCHTDPAGISDAVLQGNASGYHD
jgi:hypothetical protein